MRDKPCTKDNPCKIVLVDDEAMLRRLFADELLSSGEHRYRAYYADCTAQMKEICDREGDIEAIILDLGLEKTDGLQTLSEALCLTEQKIPITVLTGAHGGELEERALEMGAAAFCEKTKTNQASLLKIVRLSIAGYKPYLRLLETKEALEAELAIIKKAEGQVKGEVEGDGLETIRGIRERITALAKAS
jgi:DNA-binding response OmpR family regulator